MSNSYLAFPKFDPVIFSIGPVSLHWYGLMYWSASFLPCGWRCAAPTSRAAAGPKTKLKTCSTPVSGRIRRRPRGLCAVLQLAAVLDNPLYLFKVWDGGMSFHGGLMGVILVMFWFARRTKRTFFRVPILSRH
ncbi:prolipoprotein diacylglyceryl transferase [Serratia marcescens]|uniref:Prolipoprotein diacylglyceryl transferase n=1 Tax=Serratia marcescens TaxID=615 RepID=A0A939NJU4_SERMA|nr:prolipoprotein diacylglyceryl transferase [Serratia marcescens]